MQTTVIQYINDFLFLSIILEGIQFFHFSSSILEEFRNTLSLPVKPNRIQRISPGRHRNRDVVFDSG